jgi:hypothetical protein
MDADKYQGLWVLITRWHYAASKHKESTNAALDIEDYMDKTFNFKEPADDLPK